MIHIGKKVKFSSNGRTSGPTPTGEISVGGETTMGGSGGKLMSKNEESGEGELIE